MKKTSKNSPSGINQNSIFKLLFISSILAAGTHFYLIIHHFGLKLGIANEPAICNINSTFNCDAVATSRFSEFLGIPIAIPGLIAQIILLVFLLTIRFDLTVHKNSLIKLTRTFSFLICGVSVIMGLISAFALKALCLFCIFTYILSFTSAFFASKINLEKVNGQPQWNEPRWGLITILLIPAFSWLINSITLSNYGYSQMDRIMTSSKNAWLENPVISFNNQEGLILGNPETAKMIIVEFADFLCPHCKDASPSLELFTKNNLDKVALIYKTYPRDGVCNPVVGHKSDGLGCKLASAALCMKDRNLGWETHHWIFERQDSLSISTFESQFDQFLNEKSVNPEEVKTCMNSDLIFERIQKMAKEGEAGKIQGTPAIFVNGRELPRGQFPPILNSVLQSLIK